MQDSLIKGALLPNQTELVYLDVESINPKNAALLTRAKKE